MNANKDEMNKCEIVRKDGLLRFLLGLVVATAAILTAYHTTIYGLKSEISTKANAELVETIDRRLIQIETILSERVATRVEMQQMHDELQRKLMTIEAKLQMIE